MKNILLFGAGKSATCLIEYLISNAVQENWHVTVADTNQELILVKTKNATSTTAIGMDINNETSRKNLIENADLVISMLPPLFHFLVAKDCVALSKNLLTASYVDDEIKTLKTEIENKQLLFLCEMGLDPGLDHMSAMRLINHIKKGGGNITSFQSHCGGLVAPESDNNPWRYKFSWNPRNVVLAGKAGALYKLNGLPVIEKYDELFDPERGIKVNPEIGFLSFYPNRDSLSYIPLYGLENAETFMRTTLRYPDFMYGWNNVVELKLTDETPKYQTNGLSLAQFFKQHFNAVNFSEWATRKMGERLEYVKKMAEDLDKLTEAENAAEEAKKVNPDYEIPRNFALVNEQGELVQINIADMKDRAASAVAHKTQEVNLTLKQLFFLGMDDNETLINKGLCSAADVLQFAMETKLPLMPSDKDMVVMVHELEFENQKLGSKNQVAFKSKITATLVVKGNDNLHTAMAKTVGLPLGIAAKLILNNTIKTTGLHIPILPEIYEPVLNELEKEGIVFDEKKMVI